MQAVFYEKGREKTMKSPDEIKKGLECGDCKSCPYGERNNYDGDNHCGEVEGDALAYIQQLEAGIAEWEDVAASPGAVEDMAREIDWLKKQLRQAAKHNQQLQADNAELLSAVKIQAPCYLCKHHKIHSLICEEHDWLCDECDAVDCVCLSCEEIERQNWEWRGARKEGAT